MIENCKKDLSFSMVLKLFRSLFVLGLMILLNEEIQKFKLRKKSIFSNIFGAIKNKNRTFAPLFYKNSEGLGK